MVCGVGEARGKQWWNGASIPLRYAPLLVPLFGKEAVREIFDSFPRTVGSGRRAGDNGRRALRMAARELRARGNEILARQLEEIAT